MDQINFSAWENRVETRTGGLSAQLAAMAQATLGGGDRALGPGDVMPPLWHWFAFAPTTPTADLGRDGHPQRDQHERDRKQQKPHFETAHRAAFPSFSAARISFALRNTE